MSVVAERRRRGFGGESSELKENTFEDLGVVWWNNFRVVIQDEEAEKENSIYEGIACSSNDYW